MGHVCCMGTIMGLCLFFCVFFCKPVDVVEGISLRACCFDGGVCKVACSGCAGGRVGGTGAFVLALDSCISALLPCMKGTGAAADMHESPTMPIMLLRDGH